MYHPAVSLSTSWQNGTYQTNHSQPNTNGLSHLGNNQFGLDASPGCEICSNPISLESRVFGFRCCKNCYNFMLKSPRDRPYICAFAWNCNILWNSNEFWPRCEACCWKKITERSNLRFNQSTTRLATDSTARPSTTLVSSRNHSTPAVETNLINRPSGLLICDICSKFTVTRFGTYGPLCCRSCHQFIKLSRSKTTFYKCLRAGQCQLKWEPNKSLCNACRMKKISQHPQYILKNQLIASSSNYQATISNSTNELTYQAPSVPTQPSACVICERPNPLYDKPYGILCCAYCVQFILKIASKRRKPSRCRLSTNKCEVKWLSSDRTEPCASCKWKKIESNPDFTLKHLKNLPVESPDWPVVDPIDNQLKVSCSICDGVQNVSRSKYGVCCKECLSFIDRTISREIATECFHNEEGLIMWKAKNKRWFIMCKAKALRGMGKDLIDEYHLSNETGMTSQTVEGSDNHEVSTKPEAEDNGKICSICKNRSFVSFSQRYGLAICNNCYRFLRRTKRKKLTYECQAAGNCDIFWAANKVPCDSCLLDTILNHPDFLIESMS